ncbi:TonB-dependent receptor plug domain-containing protein [Stutzerimonas nitrititolerans]|uniref:TonB-dependent receptor plug domain-containing protein n=2 Tax=Stutzerimonas nitrititolerans TaxID=2482751 RepID=UPI00026D79D1|nr:TonB-dependent receptor [Stutzerimonas nitrititolerans]AFN79237.1 TonB-dependent receptor, plug [Stutzerimonas stutzeri DSM 10701]SUD85763.1 TonB-dependent receptor, plug [Stutzerimonas stutzeri]
MKLSRLALAIALTPGLALAADESSSSAQLPPMVITRATNLKAPTPASVAVIDREQIEASASSDLLDVLRSQAGLQIRDTMGDGNRAAISLRGFGENAANNTLVLVDGRRLNQPTLASADLNSVPLANIERIEIIRGAGTVLYGDQAVGGVINIITRTPSSNEAYVEASRGSHDHEAFRGHLHQQLGGGFSLYASGETRSNDNYRDHNNADYSNAFARLRYEHDNGHVFYEYQTVDDELLFPNALSLAQRRQDRKQSNSLAWNDSKSQVHRLALEQRLSEVWSAHLDYSHSDQDGVGSFGPGSEFTQGTRIETISPRLTARFDSPLGQAEWLLGHDHITSDYEYLASWGDTLAQQTLRDWYTQFSQDLGNGLNLVIGYRASEADDESTASSRAHRDREGSGSIGLSWQANEQTRVFIRREDVLRWANVDENGFVSPGVTFLKPQTGESWESGVEWNDTIQQYRLTVYRLELEDELMYDPTAPGPNSAWGFDGANINLDKTLRKGILLEAERQLSADLSIGGQYSFTDSEYRDGSFKGNDVPWVSRHSASAHVSYEILPGLRSYVEAVYTGKRYYSGDDANIQQKAGSYTLVNAALAYEYKQFNTKLRINNLTGKRYDAFATAASRYPAPEEEVQLSVGYRF